MTVQRLPDLQAALAWLREHAAGARLVIDSRRIQPGDVFIAWPGAATDGRHHVGAALAAGAAACLVEAEGVDGFDFADPRIAALPALKAACGPLAADWQGRPAERLAVVAVTGTNGKSSTAWWTAQALTALGRPCEVAGTLGVGRPPLDGDAGGVVATGLTTADPVTLQAAFARMVAEGVQACAIEASSIGLAERRLAGTPIAVAQFTNFTRDHLDYHGTMAAYWQAKRGLFGWPGLKAAVVNVDDPAGADLAAELGKGDLDLWTTAVDAPARLRAGGLHYADGGLAFDAVEGGARAVVRSTLIGAYNAHNLLAVLGALRALGVPLADAAAVVPRLTPVPGRMQRVPGSAGAPEVVVDYAHTPDALEKAIAALRPLAVARGGKLWCVFGCGGNRDATKRPLMGAIAERLADRVLVTSDNSRDEDPEAIVAQVRAGLAQAPYATVADRRAAIVQAITEAAPADVVLVAGKGHEDYQEVRGRKLPFLDAAVAGEALAQRAAPPDPVGAMATLGTLHALLPRAIAARFVGDAATAIARVHSDTRTLQPGDLFVALRGERFDAHDFLRQAKAAGAVAALAERGLEAAGLPGIEVPDALAALQQLAAAWRARFALPLVAVTGSNGKTTVTQMLASILRAWQGDAALATAGNFNNHIGVPLTLLRLREAHRCAVLELGMNHPGEIALLAALAAPTVVLVNNAQREHQEFMQSVAAVAEENGSAIAALPADGVAVFPADDEQAAVWQRLAGGRRRITFATAGAADVTGPARWLADAGAWALSLATPAGPVEARVHAPGEHNRRNAMAAAAAAVAAGVPAEAIARGLADFRPVAGRSALQMLDLGGRRVALVDDSYNANPDSVRAAIDLLAGLPGPRWLVLGDMGEVGDQGPAFHAEVGAYARQRGIEHVWAVGPQCAQVAAAYGSCARHFADAGAAVAALEAAPGFLPACASVLVKGSRFMRMERVVQVLRALAGTGAAAAGGGHAA